MREDFPMLEEWTFLYDMILVLICNIHWWDSITCLMYHIHKINTAHTHTYIYIYVYIIQLPSFLAKHYIGSLHPQIRDLHLRRVCDCWNRSPSSLGKIYGSGKVRTGVLF